MIPLTQSFIERILELEIVHGEKSYAMALKGIRVIELAGLAPVPFCGMILVSFNLHYPIRFCTEWQCTN